MHFNAWVASQKHVLNVLSHGSRQPQPPVLDRRLSLSNVGGHDGEGAGDAVTSSSSKSERERAACLDRGEGTGDNLTLSFVSADSLYRQAREVGGFVTTGSDR